ncbi:MAG: tpaK [Streptosporangiaceae bacterium]|nr:tpaK [Streptosporangiaceae bacterium]
MSPSETSPLRLPQFIDDRRVGLFQYVVVGLCAFVMFMDGFDTQAISYAAPHIAKEWGLSKQELGLIFSSALAGLMIGYLVLSPLSERFGHKRLITVSSIAFGLCTLTTVWSQDLTELMALRFITGIGLGAAAPSAVALTAEFSPKRLRASFVLVIYCGFSFGFIVAGMASDWLIPALGWRALFWVGALAPLVLVPALLRWLPESPVFMIQHSADPQRIYRVFRKIDRKLPPQDRPVFTVEQAGLATSGKAKEGGEQARLRTLFTRNQVLGTLLLWLVFVINLGEFYALQSWLPSIMTSLHYPMHIVVTTTTLTAVGGIAAALVSGPAMDRLGAYGTLATVYVLGFVFVAATGLAFHAPLWILLVANFLAGCCISGGQKSLIAFAAIFYPAQIRSTGVGWALGIGRVGGIIGPLVVGTALGLNWSASAVFYAMAVPMLVAGLIMLVLGRRYGRTASAPAPETQDAPAAGVPSPETA